MPIIIIDYSEILKFWSKNDMWGNKNLNKVNPYTYDDKYMPNINYSLPEYYGLYFDNKIVGVNSYYHVNENECRSRGLYVIPEYRKMNFGKILLEYAIKSNSNLGYKFIWSKPRYNAVKTYESAGFKITSDIFDTNPDGTKTIYSNYKAIYKYE